MLDRRELEFEGIHCKLAVRFLPGVVVVRIQGTDVGEFGDAPMTAVHDFLTQHSPVDLFIDARDVHGASIEVSGVWASWLSAHRSRFRSVTMLTGSRLIQVTAEFVRRFSRLEATMRICTEPAAFDHELTRALHAAG